MTLKVKPSSSFSLQVNDTKYYLLNTIQVKVPKFLVSPPQLH